MKDLPPIEQYKRIQAKYSALTQLNQAIDLAFEQDWYTDFLRPELHDRLLRVQREIRTLLEDAETDARLISTKLTKT